MVARPAAARQLCSLLRRHVANVSQCLEADTVASLFDDHSANFEYKQFGGTTISYIAMLVGDNRSFETSGEKILLIKRESIEAVSL